MIRHQEHLSRAVSKLDALKGLEGSEDAVKELKGELEAMKQLIADKQAKKANKK
jgi:hypothetical protein